MGSPGRLETGIPGAGVVKLAGGADRTTGKIYGFGFNDSQRVAKDGISRLVEGEEEDALARTRGRLLDEAEAKLA